MKIMLFLIMPLLLFAGSLNGDSLALAALRDANPSKLTHLWNDSLPLSRWHGIHLDGLPQRVMGINLVYEQSLFPSYSTYSIDMHRVDIRTEKWFGNNDTTQIIRINNIPTNFPDLSALSLLSLESGKLH